MASQAFVNKIWRESSPINWKSTGTTVLIPAISGKLIVRTIFVHLVTRTGSGTGATLTIGANSATWNNLYTGSAFGGAHFQDEYVELSYNATSKLVPIDLANGMRLNISAASTFTTDTGIVYIEGIVIP